MSRVKTKKTIMPMELRADGVPGGEGGGSWLPRGACSAAKFEQTAMKTRLTI
jgi:hypothetical protein